MRRYRSYDHRLKRAFREYGNPSLFPELGIPRSTILGWIRRGVPDVVTADVLDLDTETLVLRCQMLARERDIAFATQKLASFTFKLFGLQIQFQRLPRGDDKSLLLRAVKSAAQVTGLTAALRAIGLSAARFSAFCRRERGCDLDDHDTCPKLSPTKLTPTERQTIRAYARDKSLAHISTTALAWIAKRRGELFASATTWCKLVRKEKLRVTLPRIYPAAPKLGVRAEHPCQIWHIDVSIIRLVDSTRAFIQAVIDNASRFIVAHRVVAEYGGLQTKALLQAALARACEAGYQIAPNVWCDSGVENLNTSIDALVDDQAIVRTIAQLDVAQSNSMIEAFFRRLKHAWLFVHLLTDVTTATRLTNTYVSDHNELIPHYALAGATPAEIFFGESHDDRVHALGAAEALAKATRASRNRALACARCSTESHILTSPV